MPGKTFVLGQNESPEFEGSGSGLRRPKWERVRPGATALNLCAPQKAISRAPVHSALPGICDRPAAHAIGPMPERVAARPLLETAKAAPVAI